MVAPIGVAVGYGEFVVPSDFVVVFQRGVVFPDDGRGAAFGVGDEQAPGLALAVAPLRDVVAVEACGLVGFVAGQHGFATGGFLAELVVGIELHREGEDADDGNYCQNCAGLEEMDEPLLSDVGDELGDDQDCDDEQQVIGDLQVVGEKL